MALFLKLKLHFCMNHSIIEQLGHNPKGIFYDEKGVPPIWPSYTFHFLFSTFFYAYEFMHKNPFLLNGLQSFAMD